MNVVWLICTVVVCEFLWYSVRPILLYTEDVFYLGPQAFVFVLVSWCFWSLADPCCMHVMFVYKAFTVQNPPSEGYPSPNRKRGK